MEEWMFWILYLVVFLLGIFVVVPYIKANVNTEDGEEVLFFGIAGSILWPVSIVAGLGYIFLWLPGIWLFKKSEKFFAPKSPPTPLEVDHAKSSYRHVEYIVEDENYSPHREV